MDHEDFNKKINAGAGLVQIYSGFIVKGPKIVKDILKRLSFMELIIIFTVIIFLIGTVSIALPIKVSKRNI